MGRFEGGRQGVRKFEKIMIRKIDVSILFEEPDLAKSAVLWIEPLAPLSMVVSMPGSYYRTQDEPSVYMIYGALENLLGWHFDEVIRKAILKKMRKELKKKHKIEDILIESSLVNYIPILQNHLIIETPAFFQPQKKFYEDYWTQHMKHDDERHLKGVRNYDLAIERLVTLSKNLERQAKIDKDEEKTLKEKAKAARAEIMKNMRDKLPLYYSSPKKREFVAVIGKYGYKIQSSERMIQMLVSAVSEHENPIYLGTNEGWVDIKIQQL